MCENRRSQGPGGGGDEDRIPGEVTVPTVCNDYEGTGTMSGEDSSSAASMLGRCPVPREPEQAELPDPSQIHSISPEQM